MSRIRREPEAHIQSLKMDPERRIMVVEGKEDRLLLEHICDNELDNNTIILEIESVELPDKIDGGNRGRIIHFALLSEAFLNQIKFFIDKDYSSFIGEVLPKNVITTDYRDIENYLFELNSVDKFLKIGLKTEKLSANQLLNQIYKAKDFGIIRITSLINELKLSINKTNEKLSKYITIDDDFNINIDYDKYLVSLIQNTSSKHELKELKSQIDNIRKQQNSESVRNLIHGKDALSIIQLISLKINKKNTNIESAFWMSFEPKNLGSYEKLNQTIKYLKNLP